MSNETLTLTNSYWELLKSLSDDVKLRLATRLTASVVESKKKSASRTEEMLDKYCGAWKGEQTAEEIIENISKGRQGCKEPLNL